MTQLAYILAASHSGSTLLAMLLNAHPEVCSVFDYHKIFNAEEVPQIEQDCRAGTLGCVDCKKNLADKVNEVLDPIRARRVQFEREPKRVSKIMRDGCEHARQIAEQTMEEVREAMSLPQ